MPTLPARTSGRAVTNAGVQGFIPIYAPSFGSTEIEEHGVDFYDCNMALMQGNEAVECSLEPNGTAHTAWG